MILVTGGSGLLGQHLLEVLTTHQKVKATFRDKLPVFFTSINEQNIEWIDCDITDIVSLEKAFDNVTHVYHCAALVSYDPRMKDLMTETNIEGTANIVNLCLDHQIKKLCYVSSIATIGEGIEGELLTEKNDWDEGTKNSNYAISKQGAEMEVWRGIGEGLNAVIVNPGIILGEGDDSRSSANLFKIIYDGFDYYTSGATCWVDVKDVVKAMILLMNSDIQNQRYILCEGNHSYREIFSVMADAMNKKAPYKMAGKVATELVWRVAYLKSLWSGKVATITKETAQSAQQIRQYDNSKFQHLFSEFTYTNIQECIQRIATKYNS